MGANNNFFRRFSSTEDNLYQHTPSELPTSTQFTAYNVDASSREEASSNVDFLSTYQTTLRSTEQLHSDLHSANWQTRRDAILAIERLGTQTPPMLMSALKGLIKNDRSSYVRETSIRALGVCKGKDKNKTIFLLALADKDWNVRAAAIHVLGLLEHEIPVDTILHVAKNDEDFTVRTIAIAVLSRLKVTQSIPFLLLAIYDTDDLVRAAAVTALGTFHQDVPVKTLVPALRDENEIVRAAAAEALGNFKSEAPIGPLLAALQDEDSMVRAAIIKTLGNIGPTVPLYPFQTALLDADAYVRLASVQALGKQKPYIPIDMLIFALKDNDELVRSEVFDILKGLNKEEFQHVPVDAFINTLHDANPLVRSTAVWALGKIIDRVSLTSILYVLDDEDATVRASILWTLSELGEQAPLEPFITALRDPDRTVRKVALKILGIMQRSPVEPLLQSLRDPDHEVRATAVSTLSSLRDRVPIEAIILALDDPTLQTHIHAQLKSIPKSVYKNVSQTFLLYALKNANPAIQAMGAYILGEQENAQVSEQIIESLALASFHQNAQLSDAANWALLHLEEKEDHPKKEQTFVEDNNIIQSATNEIPTFFRSDASIESNAVLIKFLKCIEDKRGFIRAEKYQGSTLVLKFCYEEEETAVKDDVFSSLGLQQHLSQLQHALQSSDQTIQQITTHVTNKLAGRSWSEICFMSLEKTLEIPAATDIVRIVICAIGYRKVRQNDVSIRQVIDQYFYQDHSAQVDQDIHRYIDIAFHHILDFSKMQLWYEAAFNCPPAEIQSPRENIFHERRKNHSQQEQRVHWQKQKCC